jgi:hypothetical protein
MRQFLLFVFALLVPCFVLWTAAGNTIALPATGLANLALSNWFPDMVHALMVDGPRTLLMTEMGEKNGQPVPLSGAEFRLGFRINPLTVSYSLPFYTALYFATPRKEYLVNYLLGLSLLYGFVVIGVISLCLKELMVNLGNLFLEQTGAPGANVIGTLYQFNVLIVPTLVPVMLWVWQSRETDLLRDALGFEDSSPDSPST